jgi:predicted small secreted protein
MFKRTLLILLLVAFVLCFAGCQTLGGFGGDVKWTGEQIEAGAANLSSAPPPAPPPSGPNTTSRPK